MGSRTRQKSLAVQAAVAARRYIGEEIAGGRADRDVTQRELGQFAGMSRPQVGRAEHATLESLTIEQAAHLLAGLGLRLSVRAYPVGDPIRDAGQVLVLSRVRHLIHSSLLWRTEVGMPIPGDLRAWDAVVGGPGWQIGVEVETRPRDVQALLRRLALKVRDSSVDGVLLVLLDSAANRRLLATHGDALAPMFTVAGDIALECLAAGRNPGGSAVVLVATAPSIVARRRPGRARRKRLGVG